MKRIIVNASIIFIVLIVLVISYFSLNKGYEGDLQANIYHDDVLIDVIDLSILSNETEYSFIINDNEMIFIADYNKIRVVHVDCPKEICKAEGFITMTTQMIICAPNKVVVTLSVKS